MGTPLATRSQPCQVHGGMFDPPVTVWAGASLLGWWLLSRVQQHQAFFVVSQCSNLRGATHTQQLRRQLLQQLVLACETHFLSSCVIQTLPMDCSDDGWSDTYFWMHGALWPPICGALAEHLLIYLLTVNPQYDAGSQMAYHSVEKHHIPTVKDIMHINEILQHDELPYRKSVPDTAGLYKEATAAMLAVGSMENSKSPLYFSKFLVNAKFSLITLLHFSKTPWKYESVDILSKWNFYKLSHKLTTFLCH